MKNFNFGNRNLDLTAEYAEENLKELERLTQLETVLRAAVRGEVVQIKMSSGDYQGSDCTFHEFTENPCKYRIKPKTVVVKKHMFAVKLDNSANVLIRPHDSIYDFKIDLDWYKACDYKIIREWTEQFEVEVTQ